MYHMPEFKAPQKNWDDWFSRIAGLKNTYTDINDSVVIPMLLSHLRVDDKRYWMRIFFTIFSITLVAIPQFEI